MKYLLITIILLGNLFADEKFDLAQIDIGKLLEDQLEAPKTGLILKTTILAVIGLRGKKSQLPIIRKYARHKNAALKAAAIGSLGLIGDNSDLSCITKAIEHKNGRVRLAAVAAMNRIVFKLFQPARYYHFCDSYWINSNFYFGLATLKKGSFNSD